MAEASSGLDTDLEASGKINSVIFISIYEVSKNWKESEEVGSVADTTKNITDMRKGSILLHPTSLLILLCFTKAAVQFRALLL